MLKTLLRYAKTTPAQMRNTSIPRMILVLVKVLLSLVSMFFPIIKY